MLAGVDAFWCRPPRGNVGDQLTPWLIARISGRDARWVPAAGPGQRYFVAGSIAGLAGARADVWGSGVMRRDDVLDPAARFHAVRGPLTREAALRSGARCPDVYGDPGWLVPRLLPRPRHPGGPVGYVAHLSQVAGARRLLPHRWRLIDVRQPVEEFVDDLTSCSLIVSTSLHGIILAHAYGLPAVWAEAGRLPMGDGTKFHDHYLGAGIPMPPAWAVGPDGEGLRDRDLYDFATTADGAQVADRLLDACPFRPALRPPA
jgi:pyruvyltransferase